MLMRDCLIIPDWWAIARNLAWSEITYMTRKKKFSVQIVPQVNLNLNNVLLFFIFVSALGLTIFVKFCDTSVLLSVCEHVESHRDHQPSDFPLNKHHVGYINFIFVWKSRKLRIIFVIVPLRTLPLVQEKARVARLPLGAMHSVINYIRKIRSVSYQHLFPQKYELKYIYVPFSAISSREIWYLAKLFDSPKCWASIFISYSPGDRRSPHRFNLKIMVKSISEVFTTIWYPWDIENVQNSN